MKSHVIALLVLIPVGALLAQEDAGKKELATLQGVWRVVRYEEDGREPAPDFWRNIAFVFEGNQLKFKGGAVLSEKLAKVLVVIDPATTPRVIDLKVVAGTEKGIVLEGIYELKGDELKICCRNDSAKDRPTEFGTKPGSNLVQFVLRREKR